MKLTVTTFMSLDGVMQGPGGPDEDVSDDFRLGGWVVPYGDEDFGRIVDDIFSRVDEFLLGRTTYEMMYAYWSQVTEPDNPVAVALNTLPKHIATTRDDALDWENSHAITGDLVTAVEELKERPGRELQVHGSHGLIQTLLKANLVDEFNVLTFPVVLGEGKRLFGEGAVPTSMKLLTSETTGTGAIFGRYQPTGVPAQQEYVVEEGRETVA